MALRLLLPTRPLMGVGLLGLLGSRAKFSHGSSMLPEAAGHLQSGGVVGAAAEAVLGACDVWEFLGGTIGSGGGAVFGVVRFG